MQSDFVRLHLFAGKFCVTRCRGGVLLRPLLLISSEARAEQSPALTGCTPNGFPYEGKLSLEATDEVDSAS